MKQPQKPFDPVALSLSLAEAVCKNSGMKYTVFCRSGPHGGISTGYSAGCCLRCIFCWADQSRDDPEKFGRFYSPEEALGELLKYANPKGVKRLRLSGGEPTACRDHLFGLLDAMQGTDSILTLETNGILLGADEEYVKRLSKFNQFHVRVSVKAGTAAGFQRITGAHGEFYQLPFNAVSSLIKYKMSFHVASMTDTRIMPADEKSALAKKLAETGYRDFLEEETCIPQPDTIRRLKEAGFTVFSEEWIA
ncbi:MAG: radical SAM protein [Nitrospirota bacterium]